jgi:hypothetical protein
MGNRRRKRLFACAFLARRVSSACPHQSREGARRSFAVVKPPFRSGDRSGRRLVMQARRPRLDTFGSPPGNRVDPGVDLRLHLVDLSRARVSLRRAGRHGCKRSRKNELDQTMILHRIAGAETKGTLNLTHCLR